MAALYNKLWKLLIDRKIKKTELQRAAGVSANVMVRLSKDEYVSMEGIEKICGALGCGVDDILDFSFQKDSQFTINLRHGEY